MHTLASSCSKIKKNLKDKNQRAAKQDFSRAKKGAESLYHNMPTAEEQKQCEVTAWLLLVKVHKSSVQSFQRSGCHLSFTDRQPGSHIFERGCCQPQEKRAWKKPPHRPKGPLINTISQVTQLTTGRVKSCPLAGFYSSSLINRMNTYC